MSRTISLIRKSWMRAVNDARELITERTGEIVDYWDYESRADEDKMPTRTVLGPDGFAFHENEGLWTIRVGLSLSTYNDRNNLDESEYLDILHELFGHHKKVALRDPDTGDVISELVVVEFQIMPMGQSELRNYRTIGIELLRTDTTDA